MDSGRDPMSEPRRNKSACNVEGKEGHSSGLINSGSRYIGNAHGAQLGLQTRPGTDVRPSPTLPGLGPASAKQATSVHAAAVVDIHPTQGAKCSGTLVFTTP